MNAMHISVSSLFLISNPRMLQSTINSYAWYLQAIPSKFSCANTSHFVTLFSAHGDILVGFAIFHIVIFQKKRKKRKRHSSMVWESWWAPDGID
jgi:hypothetical protein